jgi:ABC-type sugar transport system ATPase subunit
MDSTPELLRLTGVSLDYGQIEALKDVNLVLHPGKVHAIVGEHGAGKTSLGMIISGNLRQKSGSVEFAGARIEAPSLGSAHRLGIEMVYQQIQLNAFFSVAENIFFLDRATSRGLWLSKRGIERRARAYLEANDFGLDPAAPVGKLNFPDRVLVSVLAALQKRPRLLILDEALEKLSSPDLPKVLRLLDQMKTEDLGEVGRGEFQGPPSSRPDEGRGHGDPLHNAPHRRCL